MNALSISFTLGKASSPHGANIEHNNRGFIPDNVDRNRIKDNITYVEQNIHDAYDELFSESLAEYNVKQKRNDRKIDDYCEHIFKSKREEAFYEIIVQFGDCKTAPVGSDVGKITKIMLDEYIKNFKARNSNLHIFNAVLHMDEASPHLHIDVIPFYTEGKKNGLSKGVSMRAALLEQGCFPKNGQANQLVAWEEREQKEMVRILEKHGMQREHKNAIHPHLEIDEYKRREHLKIVAAQMKKNLSIGKQDIFGLQSDIATLRVEKEKLISEKISPWKSFFYSDSSKQSFVQEQLKRLNIPYRETENGFEAQECYVAEIRKVEKQFKPPVNSYRSELRDNLDKVIMQSQSFEEALEKLKSVGYEIKHGKYIAVKPKYGSQFIRLKSLGEDYSEQAWRNRVTNKIRYETDLVKRVEALAGDTTLNAIAIKTLRHYTLVFATGVLPVRKKNTKKPFTWENSAELDRLAELNKKINEGLTLEKARCDFAALEKIVSENEHNLSKLNGELAFFKDLKSAAKRFYELGNRSREDYAFLTKHKITEENYNRIDIVINDNEKEIAELEKTLPDERWQLKSAAETLDILEKIAGGTYVQSLIDEEKQRRQARVIPNGLKSADSIDEPPVILPPFVSRRR